MACAFYTDGSQRNGPCNATFPDETAPACLFPEINAFEPSVLKVSGLEKRPIKCEGSFLPDMTYISEDDELKVNISKVEEYMDVREFQHCRYRHILRSFTSDNYFSYSNWSAPFKDKITLPENTEFLMVLCIDNKFVVVSKTFFCLIPRHEHLQEMDYLNLKKRQAMSAPKETLNVIMIGLDSLPRNQFIRAYSKTYSYVMNTLQSFDLTMHSQLGKDTFMNFLPLFAGQSHTEISQWWSDDYHMDNVDMIWATFEKAGYLTLFTEDWPRVGAFYYEKKGFQSPFARYNTRPLTLSMSDDMVMSEGIPRYCSGNQVEMNFLLDYVGRFLDKFQAKPMFAVAMLTKPTHDIPTDAKMFDDHLLHFYQSLHRKGHLNNALLITFSDHGVRWGPLRESVNGFFESRNPLTILTFPTWFLRKYPDVAANLKNNTKRLTSHFDTHATLLDLLYFKPDKPPPLAPLRHGVSLLGKIPLGRTCADAQIPANLCLCSYNSLQDISVTSQLSNALASTVVNAVNSQTDKRICAVLNLSRVIRILKIEVNYSSNRKSDTILYQVRLTTTPGFAKFEASVYFERNSSKLTVGNDIERLNMYRGQADCVRDAKAKAFCYCNNLISS